MSDIWRIGTSKDTKVKITDVKLNNDSYGYSLALTYNIETLGEVTELHIPRVYLPFRNYNLTIERPSYICDDMFADLGFGKVRLLPGDDTNYFTTKVIKTKTKEMTLEEIEKKLGHKVKIVNK